MVLSSNCSTVGSKNFAHSYQGKSYNEKCSSQGIRKYVCTAISPMLNCSQQKEFKWNMLNHSFACMLYKLQVAKGQVWDTSPHQFIQLQSICPFVLPRKFYQLQGLKNNSFGYFHLEDLRCIVQKSKPWHLLS